MQIITLFFTSFLTIVLTLSAQAGTIKGTVEGGKMLKKFPAVIYLAGAKGEFKKPDKNPTMDQLNMTFIPHVLAVQEGTTIDFLNSDEVRHNVFSPDKEKYNLGTWPMGEVKSRVFATKGVYTQLCNVHPEMEGFIVVLDTPYFELTDKDGNFIIKDVPAGEYMVKTWHEKMRFTKQKISVPAEGDAVITIARKKRR